MLKYFPLSALLLSGILFTSCSNNDQSTETVEEVGQSSSVSENDLPQDAMIKEADEVVSTDTLTTGSGLQYILLKEGGGQKPQQGQKVEVHYAGFLTDGTKFDSSLDRNEPIEFNIGTGAVIAGWDEGIALLNVGSKARLIIPSYLAYGAQGYGNIIPPDATLIFDVELINIK